MALVIARETFPKITSAKRLLAHYRKKNGGKRRKGGHQSGVTTVINNRLSEKAPRERPYFGEMEWNETGGRGKIINWVCGCVRRAEERHENGENKMF